MSSIKNCERRRMSEANWRARYQYPIDQLEYLLKNDMFCDVMFLVGENEEKICAHKLILMMSSPVFEVMFTGTFTKTRNMEIERNIRVEYENQFEDENIIHLPDIEPTAFRHLLKYIYTGKFEATIQNSVDLLYAAKKYDIALLANKCSELLRSDITEDNAVTVIQAAQLLDDWELHRKASNFLMLNFGKVIEEDDFLNISLDNLCKFLEKDEIDAAEVDLFIALIRWSTSQCERQGIPASEKNLRSVLGNALSLIRFPLISAEDFSLKIVPYGILSSDESLLLLRHMSVSPEKRKHLPVIPYNDKPRSTNRVYTANFAVRLTESVYPYVSHIHYFDSFEVDQPISVVSFGFPAPDMDNASYDVAVQIQYQGSNTLTAQTDQCLLVKRRSVFRVTFDKPVRLEAGILYKVMYKLKGPDTFYADQRVETLSVQSRSSSSKCVNFKFSPYSCRLVEIAFIF